MYFSGTKLALCFHYELLTPSMGNTVILDFTAAKSNGNSLWSAGSALGWTIHFPKGKYKYCVQPSTLTHHSGGLIIASFPHSHQTCLQTVGCQKRRKIPVPTAPSLPLHGWATQPLLAEADCTGTLPSGERSGFNTPWLQPDHPFVQQSSPSHKLTETPSKTLRSQFHHKA